MPESTRWPLGELIRSYRIRSGLSQEALAETSGVSVRTISDLERGQRTSAHLETIRLLAIALDLIDSERQQLIAAGRPVRTLPVTRDEAPGGSSSGASPWATSIPTPATALIGRTRELAQLTAWLEEPGGGVVTLTGPGGVGKTRLAIEAAHLMASNRAGGACFVNLAPLTGAERVPNAIARGLGLSPQAESVGDQLQHVLSNREALLILDNFEHVIDASPLVAQLDAACPRLTVLVTSRTRLRLLNEREFPLPPLTLANDTDSLAQLQTNEANLLFAEHARRIDPAFVLSHQNAVDVTMICQRLDGFPLAIELAASRLRILPVPAVLERLERRLPFLTGGERDRPPHQQSMRETIAWSYELLAPHEQRFLRWMAVFTGGVSLESAEALGEALGLDPIAALETVTNLVESGLALHSRPANGNPRFQLFETIREFGLEQLAEANELNAARLFHATYFLEFASQDTPRPDEPIPVAWAGRLAGEYPNLLVAFDSLCVPETADQILRFAAAMGPYWHTRGPFSDWLPRLSRALKLASPDPTIRKVHVLYWMSLIQGTSPDFEPARQTATRCLEMADQVGTTSDRAGAIQILAQVHEVHGHWETARELRARALDMWISVGNAYKHAVCLLLNAGVAYALGDLERAQREATQAGAMFEAMGDVEWSASATWYQGIFSVAGGRLDLGAACYEQSLRAWMQSESRPRWYRPLVGLADVAAAIGEFAIAARLLGATDEMLIVSGRDLTIFDRPGYARAETRSQEALGSAEFDRHRLAGCLLTQDEWLLEASDIVAEAQAFRSGLPARIRF